MNQNENYDNGFPKNDRFMVNLAKGFIGLSVVIGTALGVRTCLPDKLFEENEPKKEIVLEKEVTKKVSKVPGLTYVGKKSFYTYDLNKDGERETLFTPRDIFLYSPDSTCTLEGDSALYKANQVIEHKNYFSQMHKEHEIYWGCAVDDFDGDGSADMISWPRFDDMPIYRAPFPNDIQKRADQVVKYEKDIQNYINFRLEEIR